MGKFKETLENHPFFIIIGISVTMLSFGWAASENLRVNPIQGELEKMKEQVKESEEKIKKYESKIMLDNLVIYNEDVRHTKDDVFAVLGGQVSINVVDVNNSEVKFIVDAVGEKDLQKIKSTPGERAVFNYNGKKYIINIKDYYDSNWDDQIMLSISEMDLLD